MSNSSAAGPPSRPRRNSRRPGNGDFEYYYYSPASSGVQAANEEEDQDPIQQDDEVTQGSEKHLTITNTHSLVYKEQRENLSRVVPKKFPNCVWTVPKFLLISS